MKLKSIGEGKIALNKTVQMQEAVSIGAIYEANRVNNKSYNYSIQEVCPISIGVYQKGDSCVTKIIKASTKIPYEGIYKFNNYGKKEIEIIIFEGEDDNSILKNVLSILKVTDIPSDNITFQMKIMYEENSKINITSSILKQSTLSLEGDSKYSITFESLIGCINKICKCRGTCKTTNNEMNTLHSTINSINTMKKTECMNLDK